MPVVAAARPAITVTSWEADPVEATAGGRLVLHAPWGDAGAATLTASAVTTRRQAERPVSTLERYGPRLPRRHDGAPGGRNHAGRECSGASVRLVRPRRDGGRGLGPSYRAGCPVAPGELRAVRLAYWGFDGTRHLGALVVNDAVVPAVQQIFRRLYAERFPIRRMQPVAASGETTIARWQRTTRPRSTAATPSRPGRSAGLFTPTARRSTSTLSKTPIFSARRSTPGRTALPRPGRRSPGHGRAGRRARRGLRGLGLAVGRKLDRVSRLPALLGERRVITAFLKNSRRPERVVLVADCPRGRYARSGRR